MADPRTLRWRDKDPANSLAWFLRWRYIWWLPTRGELHTAYVDVRAWLGGWCNHCPDPGDFTGGGYGHWRCEHKRDHDRAHRAVNYVWTDDGVTDYVPMPIRNGYNEHERSPWSRKQFGNSWRHRMRRMAWHRRDEATRRSARVST